MSSDHSRATNYLAELLANFSEEELLEALKSKKHPASPRVRGGTRVSQEAVDARWKLLQVDEMVKSQILDSRAFDERELYQHNIENYIGTVKVPIGLCGPLRVNGFSAQGDYYVPLATTEAALVASFTRGAQIITEAGGCSVAVVNEGVGRAPGFVFNSLAESGTFTVWAISQFEKFKEIAGTTTRFGKLIDMRTTIDGNHVFIMFEFSTGDASGQNMVTIASEAICTWIDEHAPVKPVRWYVESNMSGDKKANAQSFTTVRGKKVCAEVILSPELLRRRLHTTPLGMKNYTDMGSIASALIGSFGIQGHYANGLTALYMACGQDVACVAESAIGLSRGAILDDGSFYASVTLPNVIVGTVGGGTALPSQKACLDLMGLSGPGHARAFAEICAATVLAGELSINAALSTHHFTRAHAKLARRKGNPTQADAE